MALKKRTPIKPATNTTSASSSAATTKLPTRKPIAPPARKPIAPPTRRPVVPPVQQAPIPAPPKEVKKVEPPKPVEKKVEPPKPKPSEPRKSPQAPKPAVPAGSITQPAEPRRTDKPAVEKVSTEAMRQMPLEERLDLFKQLNKNSEKFIAIRRELPKKEYMRKDEALLRNIIPEKAPKVKNATVYYCPYCIDWQVFHYHNFTGYNKCTGCGITTKDMYTGIDNGIFGKE